MADKCSVPPPTARGTEGYALGLVGDVQVEESGLKGGAGPLPSVHGFEGANEQAQYKAVDHQGRTHGVD